MQPYIVIDMYTSLCSSQLHCSFVSIVAMCFFFFFCQCPFKGLHHPPCSFFPFATFLSVQPFLPRDNWSIQWRRITLPPPAPQLEAADTPSLAHPVGHGRPSHLHTHKLQHWSFHCHMTFSSVVGKCRRDSRALCSSLTDCNWKMLFMCVMEVFFCHLVA